jgi:hypothetical protein
MIMSFPRKLNGAELIYRERNRQLREEGWTAEHDDLHNQGELAMAAACYALTEFNRDEEMYRLTPPQWPWEAKWWKPTPHDRIRELVKAGALIAAEIDRIQREAK